MEILTSSVAASAGSTGLPRPSVRMCMVSSSMPGTRFKTCSRTLTWCVADGVSLGRGGATSVMNRKSHQLGCSICRQHQATKALHQNLHGVLIHARNTLQDLQQNIDMVCSSVCLGLTLARTWGPTSVTNGDPHQLSCSICRQHRATKALCQNVHGVLIHARNTLQDLQQNVDVVCSSVCLGLTLTRTWGPTSVTNGDPHQLSCSIRRQHRATKALCQNVHGVLIHARNTLQDLQQNVDVVCG